MLFNTQSVLSEPGTPIPKNDSRSSKLHILTLVLVSALTFWIGIITPPHLMDDVDGAQGAIARNMLQSGDWVTGRLDGIIFLDKAPLKYWITAVLYVVFGVHDWVARIPSAVAVTLLCLTVYAMGRWAGSARVGFYSGLVLATSIGLFLFTRVVIPDVILTLAIAISLWAFLRLVESDSGPPSYVCAYVLGISVGCAVLLKGLIGIVFPLGSMFLYLLLTGQLLRRQIWSRVKPLQAALAFLIVALPWHILAIRNNPPYFDLTFNAGDHFGYQFRGFFWFYFVNDQILRFTNGRWPRDYNTVPRLWFWLYHFVWFFPWSFALFGLRRNQFDQKTLLNKLYLLCLIWIGFVMVFFTFSTTQEYYSMPIYPALALLIGSVLASDWPSLKLAFRIAGLVTGLAFAVCSGVLLRVWNLPTPGDISDALSNNPDVYTLSLGHMADLTFSAFAYLRVPLAIASIAFLLGTVALWSSRRKVQYAGVAVLLVLFFQAARLALVTFDPYLSSYPEAAALNRLPKGTLVFNGQYYDYDAVAFYTDYRPLLLNGRYFNLEYGSYAPGAASIFIDDREFVRLWQSKQPVYVVTYADTQKHLMDVVGVDHLFPVVKSGGKLLFSNKPARAGTS